MSNRYPWSGASDHKSEILIGIIGFASGLGLGFFLGRRDQKPTYQVIPASKPEESVLFVEGFDGPVVEKSTAVKAFLEEKLQESILIPTPTHEGAPIVVNIFEHGDDDWDFEVEIPNRDPNRPYVIHRDEFFGDEHDEDEEPYTQCVLTWYEGDGILVDDDSVPIYNHEELVGELLFGHGSDDPNVVYVRNVRRTAEYEIVKDAGLYSQEVLGIEIEDNDRVKGLKHSNDRVRKLRDD